jgi:uncharacterized low-complexity protein
MSEKKVIKPVALAVGAALASSFAITNVAQADSIDSPFSMTSLSVGYMLGAGEGKCGGDKEGKDGEGSCGEGSCGGDKEGKGGEGSCGEGSCGGDNDGKGGKDGEGSCGEGSCGGDKGEEGACGGDKGEEGKCGEGSCGGSV